jgi:hypothetical protein
MPWSLFTPGKDTVPIVQEAGWAPGPDWTGAENLAPTRIRFPDCPARSQSLYRLCHRPKHTYIHTYIHTYTYLFTDPSSTQVELNVEFVMVHPYFVAASALHNRISSSVSTPSHSIPRSQLGRLCTS